MENEKRLNLLIQIDYKDLNYYEIKDKINNLLINIKEVQTLNIVDYDDFRDQLADLKEDINDKIDNFDFLY